MLIEGRYNPQYWMHVELSATEPLDTLDVFLRDMSVECCEHLSAFTIDGTSYDSEPEDFYFDMPSDGSTIIEEEDDTEEDEDTEDTVDIASWLEKEHNHFFIDGVPSTLLDEKGE